MADRGAWGVDGYDTFEGGDAYYPVSTGLSSEDEALTTASAYMTELDQRQPPQQSGGQDAMGIQDRVFIVRPDGSRYRFFRA
jgi:hypothetical protein